MVTSRVSASATPSAVGVVTSLSSPAAVRPLEPRLTPRAGPPTEVGRSFAYGSTNPGHPQLTAAVTESPIPTTTAEAGVVAPLHPAIVAPMNAAASRRTTARPDLRSLYRSLTQPTMATSNPPVVAPPNDHSGMPRSSAFLVWTSRHPHNPATMACETTSRQEERQ